MQLPVPNVPTFIRTCPLVQGEPYYLRTTFRRELEASETVFLSPVLEMQDGYGQARDAMVRLARSMGIADQEAHGPPGRGREDGAAFERWLLDEGRAALDRLQRRPDEFRSCVRRPYNTFAAEPTWAFRTRWPRGY
jgi:predicted nucleotide-binding protein (sugar kinase/HSP70/actin superfamily)